MQIIVRPFATIRDNGRIRRLLGDVSTFEIDLQPRSRVKDLLEILDLDSEIGVVVVSKGNVLGQDDCLDEGQEIALFPYLAGG